MIGIKNIYNHDQKGKCMSDKEKIQEAIYCAIDILNDQINGLNIEKTLDTPLLGKDSKLDSMAVVTFMVAIEEQVEDKFSIPISMAVDSDVASESNPFRNVASLINFVDEKIEENDF